MFSLFSKDQEKVRTSNSDLWPAIGKALTGLICVSPVLVLVVGSSISLLLSPPTRVGAVGGFFVFFILTAPLGVAGGWLLWKAYKGFHRWHTYGPSHLHLETAPVPLGETLRARIRVPIADDDQPPSGFQVRVAATTENHDQTQTWWEDWASVSGQPGPSETEVPLSVDLPARPLGSLDWTLEVTASFEDTDSRIGKPDYEASFDLPVIEPDDLDERTADDASADGSISSPESAEEAAETASADASDEEVYWSVDENGDDKSGTDGESAGSEPVSDRIDVEDGPGHRLSISFSPASSWSRVLTLSWFRFVLPLGLVGGGLLSLPSSSAGTLIVAIFIAVPSFVVAVLFFYWLWTRWLHTATVTVENGAVMLTETPLFASGSTTTIPCEALDDVQFEQTHTSSSEPLYALSLVQDSSWSTGRRSHKQEIWVAGDLDNRRDVAWIADHIREAAERSASHA